MSIRQLWQFPFADPNWPRKALPGGLWLLLSPLVLPLLLALGYLIAVVRLQEPDDDAPARLPSWRPLRSHLRDGTRLLATLLLYGWPALLTFSTMPVGPLVIDGPLTGARMAPILVWLAAVAQQVGLIWLVVAFLLFPLHLRQVAAARDWQQALSPRRLLTLSRANISTLPATWAKELALSLLSLPGLAIALVGLPFTAFWALLGVARLASGMRPPPAD